MKNGRIFGFLALLFVCIQTEAAPFKSKAPSYWQASKFSEALTVHQNPRSKSNESVVTAVFDRAPGDEALLEELTTKSAELTKARTKFLNRFGLGNFMVLDVQKKDLPNSLFKTVWTLHARYLDLQGREVQMVERQYYDKTHMYTSTYFVDAPTLSDPVHVQTTLDFFKPYPVSGRSPASANEVVTTDASKASANGEKNDAPEMKSMKMIDISTPAGVEECEKLGVEKKDQRLPGETAGIVDNVFGVAQGAADGIWDMVKGLASTAWSVVKFMNPFSSEYSNQVLGSVAAISREFQKDPKGFSKRLGVAIWNQLVDFDSTLGCVKPQEAIRRLTSVVTSTIVGPGTLLKMATKVPLTVEEIAKIRAAMKMGATKAGEKAANAIREGVPEAKSAIGNAAAAAKEKLASAGEAVRNAKDNASAALKAVTDKQKAGVKSFADAVAAKKAAKVKAAEEAQIRKDIAKGMQEGALNIRFSADERKVLKPVLDKLELVHQKRLDSALAIEERSDLLKDLDMLMKEGKGKELAKAISKKKPGVDEAADQDWIRGKIKEMADKLRPKSDFSPNQSKLINDFVDQISKTAKAPEKAEIRDALTKGYESIVKGEADADKNLLRALAYGEGSSQSLRATVDANKDLSWFNRHRIKRQIAADEKELVGIEKAYGPLVRGSGENIPEIYTLISRAKASGRSEAQIKEAIERAKIMCTPK